LSWTIRTGDGSVDLVLHPDFQTNIDASTATPISWASHVTVEERLAFADSRQDDGGGQPLTIQQVMARSG